MLGSLGFQPPQRVVRKVAWFSFISLVVRLPYVVLGYYISMAWREQCIQSLGAPALPSTCCFVPLSLQPSCLGNPVHFWVSPQFHCWKRATTGCHTLKGRVSVILWGQCVLTQHHGCPMFHILSLDFRLNNISGRVGDCWIQEEVTFCSSFGGTSSTTGEHL
jgi:hypothetical protein